MKQLKFFLLTALCLMICFTSAVPAESMDSQTVWEEKIDTLVTSMRQYYENAGEAEKITPYDHPITVSYVNYYEPMTQAAMSVFTDRYGETWDRTRWTEAARRLYNVELTADWWVADDQYEQKLRMDILSGKLPDLFLVSRQEDLQMLAESGKIWNLSDLYERYATRMDKASWESDGGYLLQMATFGGQLYGLPAGLSDTDLVSYLWIRRDWLERLNLEAPATLEDLKTVMDAFMAADFDGNGVADTIGLGVDKDLYYSTRGIFAAFGAYPECWENPDGTLVWGGTTEETRQTLDFLAGLYAEGYLDREFFTKSNSDMLEYAVNGRCGTVYGAHWLGMSWGDAREADPEADWMCIDLPKVSADAPAIRQCLQPYGHGWVAVSRDCPYPELVFKLFAMADYSWYGDDSGWWIYDENASWMLSPVHVCCSALENVNAYRMIQEAFRTGDPSRLHFNALAYWEKLHGEFSYEWSLMFGNSAERDGIAMEIASRALEDGLLFYEPFYGAQSTFMQDHWSTIRDKQLLAFTRIIIGEIPAKDGFEDWLNTFDSLGGSQITEEVNAWYAGQGN